METSPDSHKPVCISHCLSQLRIHLILQVCIECCLASGSVPSTVGIVMSITDANPCFLKEASGAGNVLILKHKCVQFESYQSVPSPSVHLLYLKKKNF